MNDYNEKGGDVRAEWIAQLTENKESAGLKSKLKWCAFNPFLSANSKR
jgi:hypothetical protein